MTSDESRPEKHLETEKIEAGGRSFGNLGGEPLPNRKIEADLDKFQKYMEKEKLKKRTIHKYLEGVRSFYRGSEYITTIKPSEIADHEENNRIPSVKNLSDNISLLVNNRAYAYGLQKYFHYLEKQATDIQGQRNASFLREKIDPGHIVQKESDIESKVVSAGRVKIICAEAEETHPELGLMLRMMYETATRSSGMIQLLWKDFERSSWAGEDLEDHQIFIDSDRSKSKDSGVVEVSDKTLNQVRDLKEKHEDIDKDDRVFFPGMTPASVYDKMWRHFNDTGEETTHFFRHSRLTHMGLRMFEEEDMNYPTIRDNLRQYARHKKGETTEVYIDIVKKKVRQKNNDLEKYRKVDW